MRRDRRAGPSLHRALRIQMTALVTAALMLPATAGTASAESATFTPVADSYVDASSPASNYGTRAYVRTDASPVRTAYLRFDVQGVTDFSSARLRLYVEASSNIGFDLRSVADTTWGETTINHNNAPAYGPVVWSSGPVNGGTWVNANVSSLVTANGPVSLALTTTDATAIKITSRQGANPPQLLVPAPASPNGYAISREGSTYRAVSQPAGSTYTGSLKSVVEAAVIDLNQGGGGTVTFGAGTYDYGSGFFDVNQIHNITFAGQGIDVTFIQNSSSAAADTEPFNFSGAFNVVIRDMTISAGGPFRSTSDVIDFDQGNDSLVERVKITASRGRGIIFDGKDGGWTAEGNLVRDCLITGLPSDGIELLAAGNNLIENCTITNVAGHGIQITKSSTSAPQPNKKSNDNVLRNNTIDNSGQDGINVNSGDRNQIIGNTVTNSSNVSSGRDGIRIGSSNSIPCDDNVVDGNIATDNQPTKTQSYGLNISSALCHRTVVGAANNFAGNRVGPIKDLGTGTIYPPPAPDTEPPTAPANLQAAAGGPDRISLSWQAATDNVAVTGYDIYRDGSLVGSVGGLTLAYEDTGLAPNTTYSYTVRARDGAGNPSLPSNVAQATTQPLPPGDTEPPTQPTGLQALAVSGCRVDLSWNASSDNVGVNGYGIYRDTTLIGSVGGSTFSYQDMTVSPGTAYSYTIDAVDAALNRSPVSSPAAVTTPSAACSATLLPIADSWVDDSQPTLNNGTSSALRVDGSPIRVAYLTFDVPAGGTVNRATLRIFANSNHSLGFSVHPVADTTWAETTITYANAPAYGAVAASSVPLTTGSWVEVDVTSLVTGSGPLSLALTTSSSTAMSLASRESGANAPQLVIETQ